jgi:hypothetical protein
MSCGLTTLKYFLQNDGYQRAENYQPGNYREQDAVPIYGKREHDEDFTP